MMARNQARKNLESSLQIMCVRWFKMQYPEKLIHHSPNGGQRNLLEAIRFKAMGTMAGFPDVFIPEPEGDKHGLFIEMKYGTGVLSDYQKACMSRLNERGYVAVVAASFEEFEKIVREYFN
jgi:hypothetical protein